MTTRTKIVGFRVSEEDEQSVRELVKSYLKQKTYYFYEKTNKEKRRKNKKVED